MPGRDGEVSDSVLMAQFYGCHVQAFEILTLRWRPRLVRFLRGMSFTWEEAEDLSQTALIKLYLTKETRSFDVSQPLEPFLYAIARNLAIAYWRREKPDRIMVPLIEAVDEACPDPPISREMMEDLMLCLGSLPENEQCYLRMCAKHGLGELSHDEIAEVLGKWPAQITRISQRARGHLRECMAGKGYH